MGIDERTAIPNFALFSADNHRFIAAHRPQSGTLTVQVVSGSGLVQLVKRNMQV